jgi:hypothetical protein
MISETAEYHLGVRAFAHFCGPAVVASALGIDTLEAAYLLTEVEKPKRWRTTHISTVYRVLAPRRLCRFMYVPRRGGWYPTITTWLRENPNKEGIVRASKHFLHVIGGEIETGDIGQTRARVTHVIQLC